MYKEIEKEYKERIDFKWIKKIELGTIALCILTAVIFNKKWLLQIIFSLLIELVMLLIIYLILCKKKNIAKKVSIIKNVRNIIKEKQECNGKVFDNILKNKNIKTKEQLREVIEFYKMKVPTKNEINITSVIWGIGITVLTILLTCITFGEDGSINLMQTIPLLSFSISFLILLVFIIVMVVTCREIYIDVFDKYDVYENFVELLSERLVEMEGKDNNEEYNSKSRIGVVKEKV